MWCHVQRYKSKAQMQSIIRSWAGSDYHDELMEDHVMTMGKAIDERQSGS